MERRVQRVVRVHKREREREREIMVQAFVALAKMCHGLWRGEREETYNFFKASINSEFPTKRILSEKQFEHAGVVMFAILPIAVTNCC